MNREEIIRMAREAIVGYPDCDPEDIPPLEGDELAVFERFAALVIANHPPQSAMSWQEGYAAGVAAERRRTA